jgi:protein phosphatase
VRIVAGNAIDIGRRRSENQDHLYAWTAGSAGLYIVADGMGGQRAGGLASSLAIETLTSELQPVVEEVARATGGLPPEPSPASPPEDEQQADRLAETRAGAAADEGSTHPRPAEEHAGEPAVVAPLFTSLMEMVNNAIDKTNLAILRHARENPEASGLGSTVTLAVVAGSLAIVANLGDSRTYLVRDGGISRLTQDHSLVATLIAMGQISDDEAYTHPQRNLIYRSLGSDVDAQPDISVQRLQPGDALLLCSDGLWDMVRDDAILATLTEVPAREPQATAERLVALANDNGGEDNISVIIIQIKDEG